MTVYRKKIVLPSLIFAFALGGCIKEDNSYCPPPVQGLRLEYSYVLNTDYKCRLVDDVKSLRAYIFDQETKILTKIVDLTPEEIARKWVDVELPVGEYSITTWGSSAADVTADGEYRGGEMAERTGSSTIAEVKVNDTTVDEFRMVLDTVPVDSEDAKYYPGDVMPTQKVVNNELFSAFATGVKVEPDKLNVAQFQMIKNTELVHLKVSGLEHLEGRTTRAGEEISAPFVSMTANNERYTFDNTLDAHSRDVSYGTLHSTVDGTEASMDVRSQRFEIKHFARGSVQLHVKNGTTGDDVLLRPLDILNDVILKARNAQGQLIWPDQASIDRVNEFTIEVRFYETTPHGPLALSVFVEGFEVINTDVIIDRP